MPLALDTQLDLLATKAPPLKHPIPTSVLAKGAHIRKLGKQAALKPRTCHEARGQHGGGGGGQAHAHSVAQQDVGAPPLGSHAGHGPRGHVHLSHQM